LGVKYSYKAGYDPSKLLGFFKRLRAIQKYEPVGAQQLVWDHPPTTSRIANVKQAIENLKLYELKPGGINTSGLRVGGAEIKRIMRGHSFEEEKIAIDKVFTYIYAAYQAEDLDRLMSFVARDVKYGPEGSLGYFDFSKEMRFHFTDNKNIKVKIKKKEINFKESDLGYVEHQYIETSFNTKTKKEVSKEISERLWFVKKHKKWFLSMVESKPVRKPN